MKKTLSINFFPWNSLRVQDQPILNQKIQSEYLINLAFFPSSSSITYRHAFQRYSPIQQFFHAQCLADLKKSLIRLNNDLVVLYGSPQNLISPLLSKLNEEYKIENFTTTRQYASGEISIIAEFEKNLKKFNIETTINLVDSLTLVTPAHFSSVSSIFTHFRKKVESSSHSDKFRQLIKNYDIKLGKCVMKNELPEEVQEILNNGVEKDPRTVFPFGGGEISGLKRLEDYLFKNRSVVTYKETRNGSIGTEYSTKFSPYLAYGCISPTQIYYRIKDFERDVLSNESTYWVIFELLWRDYFILISKTYGDKLFHLYGLGNKSSLVWKRDEDLLSKWKRGETGIPYIDANMRELKATGWMSNRGRQNVASFLTKDLKIDWTEGAEWFESLLLDFDPASNYGNWQYVSGVGNDPREDRHFNVIKQSWDYDPSGDYILSWCPELKNVPKSKLFFPWLMSKSEESQSGVFIGQNYPAPIYVCPAWAKYYKPPSNVGKMRVVGKVK